jgi:hypothetical protein
MADYGMALLCPLVQYHRVYYSMFPEYHQIYGVEQVVVVAHWNRGIHMHVATTSSRSAALYLASRIFLRCAEAS